MAKIPVKRGGRYEIFYDPDQKKFSAEVDGDEVITGTTQEQVEEFARWVNVKECHRNFSYEEWLWLRGWGRRPE